MYPLAQRPRSGQRERRVSTTNRRTPTRENFYQGRVDYNMSENDSFFFRMTADGADQSVVNGLPQFGTTSESQNNALHRSNTNGS